MSDDWLPRGHWCGPRWFRFGYGPVNLLTGKTIAYAFRLAIGRRGKYQRHKFEFEIQWRLD